MTLTEDTTVDALTIEEDVTLDLAGYSLYCTSLAGSGTITSTSVNFASPDTTEPYHVTWVTKFGTGNDVAGGDLRNNDATTPRNLFDGNTTKEGRILVDAGISASRLPLAVTYDFGEGKKVSKYKIYGESSGNNYTARSPRDWTLEGSNDGLLWTEVDSITGESWSNGQSKEFPIDESKVASYRYYRMKFTASKSSQYLELNELQFFGPGELYVNVPAGAEATVGSLAISGNIKVVKDGEGRLNGVTGIGSSTFPGVLEVNAGTVYVDADFKLGTAVDGMLTINGGTVEVNSSKSTRIGENSGKIGTVNLNGGILKTKRLVSINGTGRVNFDGGTLQANNTDTYGLFGDKVTVTVNAKGGKIDANGKNIKIGKSFGGDGAMTFKGGGTIELVYHYTCTGGTTIELGTTVKSTSTDVKTRDTILGNLVVDCSKHYADANNVVVFECTNVGELTAENVSCINCGDGTKPKVSDDGKKILVDFVADAWELTANANWSDLVAAYGAPAADAVVRIESSGRYTLTIDTDVTVACIAFTGTNPNLVVQSGATVTADTISFLDNSNYYVVNNGVVVLNGNTALKFHNGSQGVYYINAGTLTAAFNPEQSATTPGLLPEGTNQFICVGTGATYDVNGKPNNTVSVRLAAGAMISHNGTATISSDYNLMPQLILDGDAQAKISRGFGLTTRTDAETRLDLNDNTLTIFGGGSDYSFFLENTTVNGTGRIYVESGKLATYRNTHGDSWSLEIGLSGRLVVSNQPVGNTLTVGDFVNNGTDASNDGAGALVVKGTLTPGNNIKRLTLADGSTVKASATKKQTVTTAFSAGLVTIDASDITKEQLEAAENNRISVLTVPTANIGGTWNVSNSPISGLVFKWVGNGDGNSTLYLCKPTGFKVIVR